MASKAMNIFTLMPPNHKIEMEIAATTANAPKSGSLSNKKPTKIITATIGKKPLTMLSICSDLRTA